MRLSKVLLGVGFVVLAFASCNSPQKNRNKKSPQPKYENRAVGKIFPHVTIKSDTTLSYALYLPKSYRINKKNRIVFIFDAHGRGALPVERYQALSEKYNLVLAASNDSKNGLSGQMRNHIITAFMADVESRFNLDEKKMFTMGFSGGARVATLIALYNNTVAGIIGCAAGFPQVQNPVNRSFVWVGVVGNKDFNYLELVNLNRQLKANRWKSNLLTFDGKHEWPPVSVMDDAMGVMLGNIHKSRFQIDDKGTPTAMENKEVEQQRILARAMEEKDTVWWSKEMALLKSQAKTARSHSKQMMNERLISYLSMLSYIYTQRAINSHNINQAGKYLKIYELADYDNKDRYFFKAVWYAMQNKNQKALNMLQKAADLGFDDPAQIQKQLALDAIKKLPKFDKIMQEVRAN